MDPNACLEQIRHILAKPEPHYQEWKDDSEALRELVEAMDGWLTKGGAVPDAWDVPR